MRLFFCYGDIFWVFDIDVITEDAIVARGKWYLSWCLFSLDGSDFELSFDDIFDIDDDGEGIDVLLGLDDESSFDFSWHFG